MKQEQQSSVYGLFCEIPYEGSQLLGLFLTEADAEVAREAYVDERVRGLPEDLVEEDREYYLNQAVIRLLPVGRLLD